MRDGIAQKCPCNGDLPTFTQLASSSTRTHASVPRPVARTLARFTSPVVTNSRRDVHPQECAHAGCTQKSRPKAAFDVVKRRAYLSVPGTLPSTPLTKKLMPRRKSSSATLSAASTSLPVLSASGPFQMW